MAAKRWGGNFGPLQVIATTSDRPQHVIAADLDGDNDLDLAVVSFNDSKIAWFQNNGAGVFGTERIISVGIQESPYSLQAGDLDRDGDLDIVAVSYFDNTIAWYENTGAGTFGGAQNISSPVETPIFPNLADYDKDGDLDILVLRSSLATRSPLSRIALANRDASQLTTIRKLLHWPDTRVSNLLWNSRKCQHGRWRSSLPLNIGGTTVQALYAEEVGLPH